MIQWLIADEVHIANIAVHPDWRKQGIGKKLMQEAIRGTAGVSWIGLEVRRSNRIARKMYEKMGFRKVGTRKKYYAEEGEDAILYMKTIDADDLLEVE